MIDLTKYSAVEINKIMMKTRSLVHKLNLIDPSELKEINWAIKGIIELGKNTDIITPLYVDIGNVKVGNNCFINRNCTFIDIGYIEIGDNVGISANCTFIADNHPGNPLLISPFVDIPSKITIGNGVMIGANCIIMPGVTIGDYAIIGAGSIVTKDVPSKEVWAGNPARFLETVEEYYTKNNYLMPNSIK